MSGRLIGKLCVAGSLLLAASSAVRADEIVLVDGSKIVGAVTGIAGGKVTIKTDFAGVLVIDEAKVKGITSPEVRNVQLKSGDTVVGALTFDPVANQQKVEGKNVQVGKVEVADVKAVWPEGAKSPDVLALEPKWSARIELGLNGQTGNSEALNFNAGTDGLQAAGDTEFRRPCRLTDRF